MTDEPEDPKPAEHERCPACGGRLEQGYGLAGGGIGPYDYCEKCGIVCNKIQESDDD